MLKLASTGKRGDKGNLKGDANTEGDFDFPNPAEDRVVGNIVDTILFQQGRPHKWLFTSIKTGEILKKQETKLSAELIVKVFKSRCKLMKGCKPYHMKPYMANIWYYSTEADLTENIYSRLVDEDELTHILANHLYADIAAIQLYIGGWPMKGSGVFEHQVKLRPSGVGYTHDTVELASLPLDQQELTMNTFDKTAERMIINEGQHDTLKFYAAKFTRVLEQAARTKVANVVFEVNFNSSLTPIFICARNIVLVRVPRDANKIFTLRSKNTDLEVDMSLLKEQKSKHAARKTTPHIDVSDGSTNHRHEAHIAPSSPTNAHMHDSSKNIKELLSDNAVLTENIRKDSTFHGNSDDLDRSHPSKLRKGSEAGGTAYENFAEYAINKYPSKSNRPPRPATASGTFHRDKARAEKSAKLSVPRERNDRPASASAHHLTATEATKLKASYYLKLIKGDEEDEQEVDFKAGRAKRPSSAPVSDVAFGSHGVAKGGRRSSGFESRLKTLKSGCPCMGDYCGFALTQENETKKSLQSYGLEAEAGSRTWKQFYEKMLCDEKTSECNQTIAFKSILLAKAETKYIEASLEELGFELWQLYQQTRDVDQIAAGFTRCQLTRVVNKCKAESNQIIFSSQRHEKHSTWDSTSLTYKKLVYSEALVNVHPSRFYYTVPVCKDCYRIYTLMDKQREIILFHRPDVYSVSLDEKLTMKKRQKYLDAYSTLLIQEQREKREKEHQKQLEDWNAALDLEVKSDDEEDLLDTVEDDGKFEYSIHHHHHADGNGKNNIDNSKAKNDCKPAVDEEDDDGEDGDVFDDGMRSTAKLSHPASVAPVNPLMSSVESDGPIEYNFQNNSEPQVESHREKFSNRMDQQLGGKTGFVPTRGRMSFLPNKKAAKSPSISPSKQQQGLHQQEQTRKQSSSSMQQSRLQEMESNVQQAQPVLPKQPIIDPVMTKAHKQAQRKYPETISIDRLKGKGVSKEEHTYHKNAKGSMASWARLLKESQAVVPQTHKHPPHMGTKWDYHDGRSGGSMVPSTKDRPPTHGNLGNPNIPNADLRRSKSAGTSRVKSTTVSSNLCSSNKENIIVGKIRPKSAIELSASNKKPFVTGSKNVQMSSATPPNALERHQGTVKLYHNATRPSSSKAGKGSGRLLPLNRYTDSTMKDEGEKIERLIRADERRKMREQQKLWAANEREQERKSPERVRPTKGTSDSWNGAAIREANRYVAETDSPFGPAPVFELPIAPVVESTRKVTGVSNSTGVTERAFSSPEMKMARDVSGKVVVQLSKTSGLVLPYEYEKAKMAEYEMRVQHGEAGISRDISVVGTPITELISENSLNVSPCSGTDVNDTSISAGEGL